MRVDRNLLVGLLVLIVMGVAQAAEATPNLKVSFYLNGSYLSGADILDGDDGNVDGMIFFFGTVGGWDVTNLTATGTLLNGPGMLGLELGIMDSLVGKFAAFVSEDGFPTGPGTLSLSGGATTFGTAHYLAQMGSFGLTTPGTSVLHGALSSDVLTLGLGFEHFTSGNGDMSSGSAVAQNIALVPEPVSITMLGIGLLGIGVLKRRKSS
jgi:hypothetical protein